MRVRRVTSSPTILISANSSWNLVNFRSAIIRALQERGFTMVAAVPQGEGGDALAQLGVKLEPLRLDARGMSPVRDFTLLAQYDALMNRIAPAAFLPFTAKPNIFGTIAAHRRQVAVINTITGLGTGFLSGSALQILMFWLYRIALRRSQKVFFHNSDDRDLFVQAKLVSVDNSAVVAGSGVNLDRFKPWQIATSDGPTTFLFIGRLLRDKGVAEFAEAANMVRASHEAKFQILGSIDNHPKAVPRHQIQQWQSAGSIELLGSAADVRPVIANADCIVLPSYREGFPRVLLEASAMGKPVIASDVPGCRQAVEHGVTGLLCKARSAQSLAEAMMQFTELSAQRRLAMGRAGRQKAEREFSEDLVVRAYLKQLERVPPISKSFQLG